MYKRHGKIKYNKCIEACEKIDFIMYSLKHYLDIQVCMYFKNTVVVG